MTNQNHHPPTPSPETICDLALRLTAIQPLQQEGRTRTFQNGLITVIVNPSRRPNIIIEITQDGGHTAVFAAQQNEPGYPIRYNPGHWTKYLQKLVDDHLPETDERFLPIEDSDMFQD